MMIMRIGFIGLGQMGHAMATNLVEAGHEVTVWNRSPDKADALVERGATRAATPAEAAQGDVVMTMLADDAALEAVVYGDDGILGAPAVHVSHSTISVALAERLTADQNEAGGYVAAPVFGRPPAAAEAMLFVVAAGRDDLIARCEPALNAISQRVFRVGEAPSAANLVKLSGNFMIMAAVGISPTRNTRWLIASSAGSHRAIRSSRPAATTNSIAAAAAGGRPKTGAAT
ncbi:MAG: NAD(P)-dependent oxidoreductase [Sphingomonas sp.]|nr:MAG: NAD(P)-dependent oxidoreductase [Sphingomonas sp.]